MGFAAHVTSVIALLAAALVAGGQLFCDVALVGALRQWPADMGVRVHQGAMTQRPDRYMRPAGVLTALAGAVLLVLLVLDDDDLAAQSLVALGTLAAVASGVTSSREWPINDEIDRWGDRPDIARYAMLRPLWDRRHRLRTVLSLVALASYALAVVVSDVL
jgi:hypothetical protein